MSSNPQDRIWIHGNRLRAAREKRGLSQRALGRVLGLGVNQVHRYENQLHDPTTAILGMIAQELGVTTDYLLGLSDAPQGNIQFDLQPEERLLLDAFAAGDLAAIVKLLYDRVRQIETASDPSEE